MACWNLLIIIPWVGQTLSVNINYAETRQNVQFSFNEPWLTKKHTAFGLSVWNSDTYSTSTMNAWLARSPGRSSL